MVEHIKSKHSMSSSNYIQQFGTLESKAKYHSCKICQSPILQDSITLQTHLYHSHSKMTVKDYYDKFINKTMSLNQSEANTYLSSSPALAQTFRAQPHIKRNLQNISSREEDPQQNLAGGDAWSWANQCTYGCRICGKNFQLGNSFYKHLKVSHGESAGSYLAKFESLRTSTKMHPCQICVNNFPQEPWPASGSFARGKGRGGGEPIC